MTRAPVVVLLVAGWVLASAAPADASEAWTWPLSPRPAVVRPFVAPAGPYAAGHRGVDLAAEPGAQVLAAGPGIVVFAAPVAGRGVVAVRHPSGLRTTYEPVSATVARGDRVMAGTLIGHLEVAGSHCLPAACLHWGLRRGPTYLDPLALLGPVQVRLLPVWDAAPGAAPPASRGRLLAAARRPSPGAARESPSAGQLGTAAGPTASSNEGRATTTAVRGVAPATGLVGAGLLLGAGLLTWRLPARGPRRPGSDAPG